MHYKVYEPTDDIDGIFYPTLASEFEVQALIYESLRTQGYDVRGEIQQTRNFGNVRHSPNQFDASLEVAL